VEALDTAGVKTVDCRRAGFSAAETTTQLRYYTENWKQPFHKDYTETSVSRAFEQLLALRADLEEALGRSQSGATSRAGEAKAAQPADKEIESASEPTTASRVPRATASQASLSSAPTSKAEVVTAEKPSPTVAASTTAPEKSGKTAAEAPVPPTGAVDSEKCLEAIWEQLIAAPPSRGRSMSTVVLQDTKVLLSSWEVAAFVAEGDQEAEDLRRAVVARALLAVAMDERKRSGDLNQLGAALTLAKSEVSYFQGRVEQAKRAKNTEAAVNLGISTKRLLSFIEEAEKLQP
jgi:hypothetical protein